MEISAENAYFSPLYLTSHRGSYRRYFKRCLGSKNTMMSIPCYHVVKNWYYSICKSFRYETDGRTEIPYQYRASVHLYHRRLKGVRSPYWPVKFSSSPLHVSLIINTNRFYRATLCASAVFAVAWCPSLHLSDRLSRSCIVSRRLKISSNLILDPVAPSFWFLTPSADNQFQRELRQRGCKIQGGANFFAIFDWNRRLSRKWYEIDPWLLWLLWNVNRKS